MTKRRRASPAPAAAGTLVDRTLARIKNNRVAAALILLALGIGALGTLSDSIRTLTGLVPAASPDSIAGTWASEPAEFYGFGSERMVLVLSEPIAGALVGTVRFDDARGEPRSRTFDVVAGRRDGAKLSFEFSSGVSLYTSDAKEPRVLRETVTGEVDRGALRLLHQREGHTGVFAVAHKVATAKPGP